MANSSRNKNGLVSPYELITIRKQDLEMFRKSPKQSRIGIILSIVLDTMPPHLKALKKFISPQIMPVKGFEDENTKGYEIVLYEHRDIEEYVKRYIPFLILKKK